MMYICDEEQKNSCYQDAVEQYLEEQNDKAAESLARTRPFNAAQKVYKMFILGIGPKWTLQHCGRYDPWNVLVRKVCDKYGIEKQTDMNPELLAEANIYMIDLMKELL